jgi:hypothetical protein
VRFVVARCLVTAANFRLNVNRPAHQRLCLDPSEGGQPCILCDGIHLLGSTDRSTRDGLLLNGVR